MTTFDTRVEIAFDSGYATAAASRGWTDVTTYVESQNDLTITCGRADERGTVGPSTLSGLVLNNIDGRFTPEYAAGANYPNVKKGRPARVRVRYPAAATQPGNFLSANAASMETSIADWIAGGSVPPTLSQSTTHAEDGTKALLITWATGGVFPQAQTQVVGLSIGRTYTAQARVWVPAGSPDVKLAVSGISSGTATSTKNAFATISYTFVATSSTAQWLQVWPHTAPTAGQQVWVDSVMIDEGSSVGTFTTTAPSFYDLFTGYVDEWAVAWPDGGDTYATTEVAASSRSARFANAAPLRSIIEEEIGLDAPALYYPLGEAEGATTAGNASTTRQDPLTIAQAGSGGTLDFGTGTGPGTDGLSAPMFTRDSAGNGKYLTTTLQGPLTGFFDSIVSFGVTFNTSVVGVQTLGCLWMNNDNFLLLGIDATGKLHATAKVQDNTPATNTATATSAGSVADGATHRGTLRVALNDGTGQGVVSLNVDGTVVSAAAISWATFAGATFFPAYTQFTLGGPARSTFGGVFDGTLSHAAVFVQQDTAITDARLTAHYTAGATGFAGESSDTRIRRYAGYAGIASGEITAETGLALGISHVDTTGASPLELMQRVTATEDGLLFDDRSGGVVFHARSHRYNVASAFTLDIGQQEVEADLAPKLDDQGMMNDVTASRPDGITIRAVDTASIAEYGYYRDTLELLTTSDGEVQSAADWRVARYGTPRVKIPAVSVDLMTLNTSKIPAVLSADLGTRFTLTGAPVQAPASSQDLFIEGSTITLGVSAFDVSWNVSPVVLSAVWQLDSASLSQLDTSTVLAY